MNQQQIGRMLLSHNFALPEGAVRSINREEFAEVFTRFFAQGSAQGESNTYDDVNCASIDNPHWIVELRYPMSEYSPAAVGELVVEALASYRQNQSAKGFYVMTLGGMKTTPPTGALPALQAGEWGVDVVETRSPADFLAEINWDKLAGAKPEEQIFKIERSV